MKTLIYLFIIFIVFYLFHFIMNGIGISDNRYQYESCSTHEKFFKSKIKNGIVKSKFLDSTNHMTRTVVIDNFGEEVIIFFNLVPDLDKFEYISVGDTICKNANTFKFFVLNKDSTALSFNCNYD